MAAAMKARIVAFLTMARIVAFLTMAPAMKAMKAKADFLGVVEGLLGVLRGVLVDHPPGMC